MFYIVQQVLNLIKMLHSENSENQIAVGFAMGLFAACSPISSLQVLICLLMVLFLRVQLGAFLISWLVFTILFIPLYSFFAALGDLFLTNEGLKPTFIFMQKNSVLSLTQFNNNVVLGGLIFSLIVAPTSFFVFKFLISKYRKTVVEYFKTTKFYYFLKSTILVKLYGVYSKYEIN